MGDGTQFPNFTAFQIHNNKDIGTKIKRIEDRIRKHNEEHANNLRNKIFKVHTEIADMVTEEHRKTSQNHEDLSHSFQTLKNNVSNAIDKMADRIEDIENSSSLRD